jgi:hypothetical protein
VEEYETHSDVRDKFDHSNALTIKKKTINKTNNMKRKLLLLLTFMLSSCGSRYISKKKPEKTL